MLNRLFISFSLLSVLSSQSFALKANVKVEAIFPEIMREMAQAVESGDLPKIRALLESDSQHLNEFLFGGPFHFVDPDKDFSEDFDACELGGLELAVAMNKSELVDLIARFLVKLDPERWPSVELFAIESAIEFKSWSSLVVLIKHAARNNHFAKALFGERNNNYPFRIAAEDKDPAASLYLLRAAESVPALEETILHSTGGHLRCVDFTDLTIWAARSESIELRVFLGSPFLARYVRNWRNAIHANALPGRIDSFFTFAGFRSLVAHEPELAGRLTSSGETYSSLGRLEAAIMARNSLGAVTFLRSGTPFDEALLGEMVDNQWPIDLNLFREFISELSEPRHMVPAAVVNRIAQIVVERAKPNDEFAGLRERLHHILIMNEYGDLTWFRNEANWRKAPRHLRRMVRSILAGAERQMSPFLWAAYSDHWAWVHYILSHNRNINTHELVSWGSEAGHNAMYFAARSRAWDVAILLHQRQPTASVEHLIRFAANYEEWDILERFLTEAHISDSLKTDGGKLLLDAAAAGRFDLVSRMLALGIHGPYSDDRGTALWLATRHKRWDIVELLLKVDRRADLWVKPPKTLGFSVFEALFWDIFMPRTDGLAQRTAQWVSLLLDCDPDVRVNRAIALLEKFAKDRIELPPQVADFLWLAVLANAEHPYPYYAPRLEMLRYDRVAEHVNSLMERLDRASSMLDPLGTPRDSGRVTVMSLPYEVREEIAVRCALLRCSYSYPLRPEVWSHNTVPGARELALEVLRKWRYFRTRQTIEHMGRSISARVMHHRAPFEQRERDNLLSAVSRANIASIHEIITRTVVDIFDARHHSAESARTFMERATQALLGLPELTVVAIRAAIAFALGPNANDSHKKRSREQADNPEGRRVRAAIANPLLLEADARAIVRARESGD